MLRKATYDKAHKEFPRFAEYQFDTSNCNHNFCFVVYCDGETDIVRCIKCGEEKEVPCTFDDDYA